MATKTKRSRGRPTRMEQLIYGMKDNVVTSQELFSGAYDEACQLFLDIMRDTKAPAATRLNAAKTVKEAVEKALESYEEEEAKEDEVDEVDTGMPKVEYKF